MNSRRLIIFTDLDGTLLDHQTYSYEGAIPALDKVRATGTPLVLCSAKTRAEQEVYRTELDINDPFIVEDGGAVFIDKDYFRFPYQYDKMVSHYRVVELGTPYRAIRNTLRKVALETWLSLRAFGNMSVKEVADATGLDRDAATRAKAREYEETLVQEFAPEELSRLEKALSRRGLKLTHGGRFHGVIGANDKGRAAQLLINLFRQQDGNIHTVGIGDSHNDVPMLSVVDLPLLVQRPDRKWEDIELDKVRKVPGIGPDGWNQAVTKLLAEDTG